MSKFASIVIFGIVLCCALPDASAQSQLLQGPGPEPGNNQEIALKTGKQLAGVGGQCLDLNNNGGNLEPVMRPCNAASKTQRFKFEAGHLMTAGVHVVYFGLGDRAWRNACFSVSGGAGGGKLQVGACRPAGSYYSDRDLWNMRISWQPNVMEIMGVEGYCIDVLAGRTDPGAPVVAWGCSGGAGQRWVWR